LARHFVLWADVKAPNRRVPASDEAIKRLRDAVNYLSGIRSTGNYRFRFALEPSQTSRAHIYMATTGRISGSSRRSIIPRWSCEP